MAKKVVKKYRQARDHLGRFIRLCTGCGIYQADPPSRLCPGCQAYEDHLR
jgi:rubrerythrin